MIVNAPGHSHGDIPRYLDLYFNGRLPVDRLVTGTYRLENINEAAEALQRGEAIKSVIKP